VTKTNVRVLLTLLTSVLGACDSAETATSVGGDDGDTGDCRSEFEPLVKRAGALGQTTLGYECGASDCSGKEAFGENLRHDVRIDLPYDTASPYDIRPELSLTSDDPDIAYVAVKRVDLDRCAGEAQIFVQIETQQAGETALRVFDRGVEIDNIVIRVAAARALTLRATTLSDFNFGKVDGIVDATLGEPLLVIPRMLDKEGRPLLGTPFLTWQSDDDDVASVREVAVSDEEEILRSTTTDSAVFVDPLSTGRTKIVARTSEDVAATLTVRVRDEE
jgi:hypothetical protein